MLFKRAAKQILGRGELEAIRSIRQAVVEVTPHTRLAWAWLGPSNAQAFRPQVFFRSTRARATPRCRLWPGCCCVQGLEPELLKISIGACEVLAMQHLAQAIARADQALFGAKSQGRDHGAWCRERHSGINAKLIAAGRCQERVRANIC